MFVGSTDSCFLQIKLQTSLAADISAVSNLTKCHNKTFGSLWLMCSLQTGVCTWPKFNRPTGKKARKFQVPVQVFLSVRVISADKIVIFQTHLYLWDYFVKTLVTHKCRTLNLNRFRTINMHPLILKSKRWQVGVPNAMWFKEIVGYVKTLQLPIITCWSRVILISPLRDITI